MSSTEHRRARRFAKKLERQHAYRRGRELMAKVAARQTMTMLASSGDGTSEQKTDRIEVLKRDFDAGRLTIVPPEQFDSLQKELAHNRKA
jgi:hypothetical protein